mmetsp:Transcript_55017/g.145253  ORF Transcript_55017/g.145253 Transcript_55017/m.145253 type:complete len:200 (+) Transcript_55017:18-617(+)
MKKTFNTSFRIAFLVLHHQNTENFLYQDAEVVAAATYRRHISRGLFEVELLGVRPRLQRRGYGSLLVAGLVRRAGEEGMEALVTAADETAVGFFQSQGFKVSLRHQPRSVSSPAAPPPPPSGPSSSAGRRSVLGKRRTRGGGGGGGGSAALAKARILAVLEGEGARRGGLSRYDHTLVMRRPLAPPDPDPAPMCHAWPL